MNSHWSSINNVHKKQCFVNFDFIKKIKTRDYKNPMFAQRKNEANNIRVDNGVKIIRGRNAVLDSGNVIEKE